MMIKSYADILEDVVRPNKELVKNYHTVKYATIKFLKKYCKPCQLGLIQEVECVAGHDDLPMPCIYCSNFDKNKNKCRGWGDKAVKKCYAVNAASGPIVNAINVEE